MTLGGTIRLRAALAGAIAATALISVAATPAQAASACDKWGNAPPGNLTKGQVRAATLCLLNRERAKYGLQRFDRSKKLQNAAQRHSKVMQERRCFAHQCPGERDVLGRLRNAGYITGGLLRWLYAENIAWGQRSSGTPRAMMKAWMNSPGHRRNILNGALRDVGIGFVKGSPYGKRSNAGTYTTDFGFKLG